MNFLKKIDLYTVSIPIYHKNQKEFGSYFGGTMTIIINILALLYTIFVLYQWRTFSILPKSQTKTNTLQGGSIQLAEQFISVGILNAQPDNIIDPFGNESNIITIYILKVNNSEISFKPIFSQPNESVRNMVYVSDLEIHINKANPESIQSVNYISEVGYFITWMKCNQTMLEGKGTCAPQEQIDRFFQNLPPLLDINVNLKQYNPTTRSFEKIIKTSYIAINNITRLYSQLILKSSKIIIDDGLIMESKIEESIVSNYEFIAYTVPGEYFLSNYNYDVLGMFILRMDNLQTEQLIVYPKFGEILAQISSITSLLFLLQHVVRYYNSNQMEKSIIDNIILHFYPNLSSYKIKFKYFWKIQSISKEGKLYNVSDFMQFYKKLQLSIQEYFNLEQIIIKQIEFANQININKKQNIFFLEQIPLNLESLQENEIEEYDQIQVVPLDSLKQRVKNKLSILDCEGEDSKEKEDKQIQK